MHKRFTFFLLPLVVSCGASCSIINDRFRFEPLDGGMDAGAGVDGGLDGGNSADAPSCTAGTSWCEADDLVTCEADATTTRRETCTLGCASETARCRVLVPSNLPETVCDTAAALDLILGPGETRYLDTDANCEDVITQVDAPEICLHIYRQVNIAEGARLVVNRGSRPLAVVATDELAVAGEISLARRAGAQGEGGAGSVLTGAGGNGSESFGRGGGGGGFGTAGGNAGNWSGTSGNAGIGHGTNRLVPLVGGSPGGGIISNRFLAGGGGGAVQLVSCRALTIASTGWIDARGFAGLTGSYPCPYADQRTENGGGGGSGGAILVEAAVVVVEGSLTANGGGGSHGVTVTVGSCAYLHCISEPQDGQRSVNGAEGGVSQNGGSGGDGGAQMTSATAGGFVGGSSGGGGGGAGRIRINAGLSGAPTLSGSEIVSPAPSLGAVGVR